MSKNISQRLEPEAHLSQSLPAQAGLTSLPGLANPAEAGGAGWLAQITLEEIHLPGLANPAEAGGAGWRDKNLSQRLIRLWRKLVYYYERGK